MRAEKVIAAAAACVFLPVFLSPASAHSIAGNRVFPATLGIDDPGVADELALPTVTYIPPDSDGTQETDISFDYAKRITDDFAVSIGSGKTFLSPGGSGWSGIGTGLKYHLLTDDRHEFMASVGLDVDWGNTGSSGFSDTFTTLTPNFYFGKGFGDLPTSLNYLRPLAVTGQVGLSMPTQSSSSDGDGPPSLNPDVLNWGFTLQYSRPYLNANVSEVHGPDMLRHLVPLVEFAFQTPVSNYDSGANVTTGFIQPGVIYMADSWQLAVEALIPVNATSGNGVGAIAELHFFLDDIFPNSIGKPLLK
jgi:hypothetical protein